jgi:hypothetical protein
MLAPIAMRLALGGVGAVGAAAAGVVVGRDVLHHALGHDEVSQGGSPNGSITGKLMGARHVIGFALRHPLHVRELRLMQQGELFARRREHELYHGGREKQGYDNGPDAFRHTYGSALIAYRLITVAGMSPEAAAKFAWDAGLAHELDSYLGGVHRGYSSAMDVHNNAVGIQLGVEQALAGLRPGDNADAVIEAAVLAAIAGGRTVVMDSTTSPPRPSTAHDLDPSMWRDAPQGAEPSGHPSVTLHGPAV